MKKYIKAFNLFSKLNTYLIQVNNMYSMDFILLGSDYGYAWPDAI